MAPMEEPWLPGSEFSLVNTVVGLSAALQEVSQLSPLVVGHLCCRKLNYPISMKQAKKYNKNAFQ